jgi:hypothetical protein
MIIAGEVSDGSDVRVDRSDDGLSFAVESGEPAVSGS